MFSKIWKKLSGKSDEEVQKQPDFGVPDNKTEEQIDQLNSKVVSFYEAGRYEEAIEYATLSVELTRQTVGEQHPSFSTSLNNLATLYKSIGDYAAAEPLLKQALEVDRAALGEQHPLFATSLNNLAAWYESTGNYAAAEPLFKQAIKIRRAVLGEQHPDFATSLNNLAGLYESTGNYAAAEPLYKQALEVDRAALGEQHPNIASDLNNLAVLYKSMGDYAAAEPLFKQAIAICRAALGEEHPNFASGLNNLAALYESTGNYAAAEPLYKQAMETYRAVLGEQHPNFASSLNNLAVLYISMGDYAPAEHLYKQAMEINRVSLGEQHPLFATSLNNLAGLYKSMGDYAAAEPLYKQAMEINHVSLGEQHPLFATSLNNVAGLYHSMGDYAAAEPLYKQAMEIRRATLGEQHPDFAVSLNNLARLYDSMGDYAAAEPLYKQAMEINRVSLGEQHPNFASGLNNLAVLYISIGDYAAAEPLYKQAMETRRVTLSEQHPDFAVSLNNLAELYRSMGDYAAAEPLHKQAMEINRVSLGEEHPDFAGSLNNLAVLYISMGDYAAAEPLSKQAMEINRVSLGEQHPLFATSLNNLAGLYISMGDYAAAEPLHKQAMEINRVSLGEQHPLFATSLNNLAGLYISMGDYAAAEPLFKQAMEICRVVLGEQHPDFAMSLSNLASLFAATGREADAKKMMEQALAIDDRMIGQVFSISSEKQRTAYLKTIRAHFETFLSLVSQLLPHSQEAVRSALSIVLRRRAIEAEALATQRDAVLGGKYPEVAPRLQEITTLRAQIAQKTLAGPGKEGLQTYQQLLAEWNTRKERLEAEVARQVPEMNLEQKLRSIDHQVVAIAMPAGATLVEFVRFNVANFKALPGRKESQWKPARYLAFVLPSGEPDNAEMIDLGEAEPIDRMIAAFRSSITGEREDRNRSTGRSLSSTRDVTSEDVGTRLREAVFTPLLKAIGNRKRLLISPDGDLTRLPFEVLPMDDGRRLIDEYRVSYVAAGRDVIRFDFKSNREPARSVVAADADFDFDGNVLATEDVAGTGRRSRDFKRVAMRFGRLPGTRLEGENIAAMLDAELWLDSHALDARLKRCQSPRILHLATHGFFLEDQKRDPNEERLGFAAINFSEPGIERLTASRLENPLLRSGLALAGVNTWLKHGELMEEAEDGLLTAEDVSGLDLLDTELVVLSACETGLGEVRVGEGVFGLRRAFVLAGAKTLVMSLWKVPDEQTRELMEDFYRRILGADGNPSQARADALREAQLAMKAKHPEPLYWGAFICQGDPGPLTEQK